jgi:hypothetical protein
MIWRSRLAACCSRRPGRQRRVTIDVPTHNVARKFILTCYGRAINIGVMTSQPTQPRPLSLRLTKHLLAYATVAGAVCFVLCAS